MSLINDRFEIELTGDRAEFHTPRPLWEAGRLAAMAERDWKGKVIYDVGAECGDFTALYGTWGARVVPFEPKPEMWPSILTHSELNKLGPPPAWWPGFASDKTEWTPAELEWIGWPAELWPRFVDGPVALDPGFRHLRDSNAPQIRLDAFADVTGVVPDAIVLDIEGAEYKAIVGCEGLCRGPNPPELWVSVHDVGEWNSLFHWYGKTLDDLLGLVDSYGYQIMEPLPWHGEGEHFWRFAQ